MNAVLIVDYDKTTRQELKTMIRRSGVPVDVIIECSNGLIALDILENQHIDVMFANTRLPEMDCLDLIKSMQKLARKPLTVAVSGHDDFSCAVELMRLGVREYILKPIDRDKISEIMQKLDGEISRESVSHQEIRHIGFQQLKYLILNRNITQKEQALIAKQYEGQLPGEDYVVCCLETSGAERELSSHYIYLSDIDGNELYIVRADRKGCLLKNELSDKCAGVSITHHGLPEIRAAYNEAWEARKEAFRQNKPYVQYQPDWRVPDMPMDTGRMTQIAQMIGTDKIKEAIKMLELIFRDTKQGKIAMDSFSAGISGLIDSITSTYKNLLDFEDEQLNEFHNIYRYSNLDILLEALTDWMLQFHEKINVEFDDYKNKQKIQTAVRYIHDNFQKDLSMTVVSNYISMNYSLFSSVFKQYTGTNFVDYTKHLRITKAKSLLTETDMHVMEISRKVGYENEKHFMKIFKNSCGVSPTEYRKNMQFAEGETPE